jgi:hypothetical protein
MFGDDDIVSSPGTAPIVAFGGETTNAERVQQLASLGYLIEPVLDPTFGQAGAMWHRHQPYSLVRADLNPDKARDVRCDFRQLPFRTGVFGSALLDPPYKYQGQHASSDADLRDRYGLDEFLTRDQLDELIVAGALECLRTIKRYGFLIVKCKDQVTGSATRWQTILIANALADHARLVDMAFLPNPSTGKEHFGRQQRHVHRNYSTFLVFKKTVD